MQKHRFAGWFVLGAAAMVASWGCSGGSKGDPNGRPVGGVVKYKGAPVEGATVTFVSPSSSAFGMTDAEGKFKLRTASGENVPLGGYQVSVIKKETPPAAATPATPEEYVPPDPNAPPPPAPKDLLPAKYGDAKTSQLTAQVTADGENNFTFDLAD